MSNTNTIQKAFLPQDKPSKKKDEIANQLLLRHVFTRAIGREIAHFRKRLSMSGKELGERLGLSQQQVSRYERGVCHINVDTLIIILNVLDVSWEHFFKAVFIRLKDDEHISLSYTQVVFPSLMFL